MSFLTFAIVASVIGAFGAFYARRLKSDQWRMALCGGSGALIAAGWHRVFYAEAGLLQKLPFYAVAMLIAFLIGGAFRRAS